VVVCSRDYGETRSHSHQTPTSSGARRGRPLGCWWMWSRALLILSMVDDWSATEGATQWTAGAYSLRGQTVETLGYTKVLFAVCVHADGGNHD
jgi:hypothetical protein